MHPQVLGTEALVRRFMARVWRLADNVRQVDLTEREALGELRHGSIDRAVTWFAEHDRIVGGNDRAETIGAVIDGWLADVNAGADTIMVGVAGAPASTRSTTLPGRPLPRTAGSPVPSWSRPAECLKDGLSDRWGICGERAGGRRLHVAAGDRRQPR